jgi:hypothetical protein
MRLPPRFPCSPLAYLCVSALLLSCQTPWRHGDRACADAARLDLPVDLADFAGKGGLWPFGVHGGAHPEGHPGIDFLLDSADARGDIAVRAPLSAEIISITPETEYPGSSCLVLDSACVEVNLCHVRLDPAQASVLIAGGSVTRGQHLGVVGLASGERRYSLHFGTYSGPDADLLCPADFLNPDTVRCRLGGEGGGEAPADCGYAPGTVTWMGRSEYAERQTRPLTVHCADGGTQSFSVPAENGLCNVRLNLADRVRMQTCLGSACAGVW